MPLGRGRSVASAIQRLDEMSVAGPQKVNSGKRPKRSVSSSRKLEGAGYLVCEKTFAGRIPRTEFRLTPEGRRVLEEHLAKTPGSQE